MSHDNHTQSMQNNQPGHGVAPAGPPDYYTLTPCWLDHPETALRSACVLTCMASGRVLDGMGGGGMGGGGMALAPEMVAALDSQSHGGRPRVVVDAEAWQRAQAALARQEALLRTHS